MIRFCTQCGHDVTYKIPDGDERARAICLTCGHIEYENPRIIVGVLPVYNDEILLCKRAIEPALDKWTIPSGFMEKNETVEQGALREAYEEAGIKPTIKSLYCIYNLPHIGQVYLLYLAQLSSKIYEAGQETKAIQFVTSATIPWDNIAFSSVKYILINYVSDYPKKQFPLRTSSFKKQ